MTGRTNETRRTGITRVQFSLRGFLAAILVFSLWLGFYVRAYQRQKYAVDVIRSYGGWVRYSFQIKDGKYDPKGESWVPQSIRDHLGYDFFHPVVEVNLVYNDDSGGRLDNVNFKEAPLECLGNLPKLKGLYLHGTQVNDVNLKHVASLTKLEQFYAWNATNLTDAGVANLRSLTSLTHIHISDSQITDESLFVFAELPRLERLSLQFNRFTDIGVSRLRKLPRLRSLSVCGKEGRPNDISDTSLEFLLALPQFKSLGVQNTWVTPEFSRRLTGRFPGCRVFGTE